MTSVYSSESLLGNRQKSWQAIISELYTALDINIPDRPDFFGRISRTNLGPVEITEVMTDQELARRTRRHISRDTQESFLFLLQTKGAVHISQFDQDSMLTPGSCALIDLTSPYLFAHSQRIELVGIKMPAAPLYARVADPHRCCGVARPARNGLGRLTADFLRSVRKEIDTVSVPFGESLGRTIVDLTGLLLDATDDDSLTCEAAPYSVMHRRCVAYVETNLCDPKLSPEVIARAMGISVRHLHRVFSSAGDSVCEFLRKGRLERCRGDLLDYRKRHLSIAEIAFRNGFISAGHFAESFKAEFGVTARSIRKAM